MRSFTRRAMQTLMTSSGSWTPYVPNDSFRFTHWHRIAFICSVATLSRSETEYGQIFDSAISAHDPFAFIQESTPARLITLPSICFHPTNTPDVPHRCTRIRLKAFSGTFPHPERHGASWAFVVYIIVFAQTSEPSALTKSAR